MSVSQLTASDGHFLFADINQMVVLFNLIYCIMALMYKWHSGSDSGVVEIDYPLTEKEKVRFAVDILSAVRHGWDVTIYVEHSDDDSDEYDTAD